MTPVEMVLAAARMECDGDLILRIQASVLFAAIKQAEHDEREACAKIAETVYVIHGGSGSAKEAIAAVIRARTP